MKRALLLFIALSAAAVALAYGARLASPAPPRALAEFMPRGAILYLQASDFAGLLHEWNASPERKAWLASDNYAAFSRSKLVLRLQSALREFASAAGIPPDNRFLSQAAGGESAIALYDIGKLHFLFISRMPAADAMRSTLWRQRGRFESRSAGGVAFYVHTDPQSGRVAAFAVADDCLLLSTREDLLAGALNLLAGGAAPSLASESWYRDAVAAARAPGELRLVLAIDKIAATPYFRSYWIQRNISEMRGYRAAISDFYREGEVDREERVLLPLSAAPPQPAALPVPSAGARISPASAPVSPAAQSAAAELLRLVPAAAGFYRVVAAPAAADSLSLVKTGVLFPQTGPAPPSPIAPSVFLTAGVVGQASDLETHIDVAPPAFAQAAGGWESFGKLIESAGVRAALFVSSTAEDSHTGFIGARSAVVLASSSPWDAAVVRDALSAAIGQEVTMDGLGAGWTPAGNASAGAFVLNGLFPAYVAVRGNDLFVADNADTLVALLAQSSATPASPAREPVVSAAGFNHSAEGPDFAALAAALDSTSDNRANRYFGAARQPAFFSGNVASLSDVLGRIASESITVHGSVDAVRQTIVYRWKQ